MLMNYWGSDVRALCHKDRADEGEIQEDEVPDDGEGRIKNPK